MHTNGFQTFWKKNRNGLQRNSFETVCKKIVSKKHFHKEFWRSVKNIVSKQFAKEEFPNRTVCKRAFSKQSAKDSILYSLQSKIPKQLTNDRFAESLETNSFQTFGKKTVARAWNRSASKKLQQPVSNHLLKEQFTNSFQTKSFETVSKQILLATLFVNISWGWIECMNCDCITKDN